MIRDDYKNFFKLTIKKNKTFGAVLLFCGAFVTTADGCQLGLELGGNMNFVWN